MSESPNSNLKLVVFNLKLPLWQPYWKMAVFKITQILKYRADSHIGKRRFLKLEQI